MVRVDGVKATIDLPDGYSWSPGWKSQWLTIWPEYDRQDLLYELKRKDFEKFKTNTVRLRLELALAEYQPLDERQMLLGHGKFRDAALGICQLDRLNRSAIECVRPFLPPGVMAAFNPSDANCAIAENDQEIPDLNLSHAWLPPTDDSFDPGIDPVAEYSISFSSNTLRSYLPQDNSPRKRNVLSLCPGAAISIAKPAERRKARVKFEIDGVRLLDFTGSLQNLRL